MRVGHAAAAYVHALTVGAMTILGPERVDAITAGAEAGGPGCHRRRRRGRPCSGTSPSSPSTGTTPSRRLADAAAERELDTAKDLAAVLDYRLDPTGNHSQRPGPLPWVPDIPETLDRDPGVGNVSRRPRAAGHRPGHRTHRAGAGVDPAGRPRVGGPVPAATGTCSSTSRCGGPSTRSVRRTCGRRGTGPGGSRSASTTTTSSNGA